MNLPKHKIKLATIMVFLAIVTAYNGTLQKNKDNIPLSPKTEEIKGMATVNTLPATEIMQTEPVKEILKDPTLEEIEQKICSTFGSEVCGVAVAVMMGESGGNFRAINYNKGSVDIGLFQINSVHFSKEKCTIDKVATVEGNILCAYSIYKNQGWSPWVAFTNKSYLKFMKGGEYE